MPRTGIAQIAAEPVSGCRLREGGLQRATDDRAASSQPALAALASGHVLAWVDDRDLVPALYVERVDPAGRPQGAPRRVPTEGRPARPRIAAAPTGSELVLVHGEVDREGGDRLVLRVLTAELEPAGEPLDLGAPEPAHAAGLTHREGAYLVAFSGPGELTLATVRVLAAEPGPPAEAEAPDAGPPAAAEAPDASPPAPAAPRVALSRRSYPLPEGAVQPANLALLSQGSHLYLAADSPEGWSIQLLEVGRDGLRRLSQVVDDRRHPEAHWCCPALGPIRDEEVAVLWQGPSPGLTSLHFLGFGPTGEPMGRVVVFEALVRGEDEGPIGRAPAFDPALSAAPYGLLAAFADNRYANSEILLAPLTCTE